MFLLLALLAVAVLLAAALLTVQQSRSPGHITLPRRRSGAAIEVRLEVHDPDGRIRAEFFYDAPVTIGRDPSNDLVLDDPEVSRRHAEIVVEKGQLILFDNLSSHGTYVDGKRIETIPIHRESQIQLGHTHLRVG
jgi:pSer/pThr/pTyr-binding forkhead associated (FHA) protein